MLANACCYAAQPHDSSRAPAPIHPNRYRICAAYVLHTHNVHAENGPRCDGCACHVPVTLRGVTKELSRGHRTAQCLYSLPSLKEIELSLTKHARRGKITNCQLVVNLFILYFCPPKGMEQNGPLDAETHVLAADNQLLERALHDCLARERVLLQQASLVFHFFDMRKEI